MKKVSLGGMIAGMMMVATSVSFTGCLTDDKDDEPASTTKTALAAEMTIAAGAQGATLGSVLDLDAGVALGSVAANAAQESIDLVFMYYGGSFHVDNAVSAKAAGVANSINLTNSYSDSKIKDIGIVKVMTKPANQEAAKAAFTAGTPIKSSVITGGEMFLVKTTEGKLALVTVGTIVGTDNKANAEFKVTINTIP
ncbi:MAG: hypothetical protein M3Y08_05130 [Fibrobacterota bacterium]|nr:hypothetical protein [Fibrobacterota bacterium]